MAKKELVVAAYNSGVSAADVDYLCDGTADEVQINQAISALDVNGTVRLLNGTYNLSQRVRLNREAITLVGSGYTRLVRRYATPDLTNGIVTVSASNCTVKDIYINVEYDTTTAANVIGVYSNQNYTKISNVIVVGYETDKIENMYGIYLEGEKSFVEKCRITELYSTQKTRGIYCTGSDCVLQDNLITGAYGGAGVDYIYVSGSNSIIENNQCIGDSFNKIQSTARGIFVQATQCSICANVCKDVVSVEGLAEGINILGEGHVVNANVCRNNYAQSSTKYGMNIYVEADNCSITANTCYRDTNSKMFSNIFVDGNKNVVASNQATIGTGAASDYTAQQSNIFLNSGTNNLIIGNFILGKDVVDENTSTTAVNLIANNKYSPSQAYDPSGISEAPSDGKQYGRKNGAWDEIIKGLPVITMEQADAITDRGVYQVNYETTEEHGDYGDEPQYNTAILVADYYIGGGEKYYRQTLYGPLGKIRRRERVVFFSWQESHAEWMDVGYIYDAPKNTTAYARKNGGWSALSTVASSGSYNDLTAKPTSMKNPNAITFTGAATGIYDGSSALTVNIPSGGSTNTAYVVCDGTNDNLKIQNLINAATDKTLIRVKGACNMTYPLTTYTIGETAYQLYLQIPSGKDIVLDFTECAQVTAESSTDAILAINILGNAEIRNLKMLVKGPTVDSGYSYIGAAISGNATFKDCLFLGNYHSADGMYPMHTMLYVTAGTTKLLRCNIDSLSYDNNYVVLSGSAKVYAQDCLFTGNGMDSSQAFILHDTATLYATRCEMNAIGYGANTLCCTNGAPASRAYLDSCKLIASGNFQSDAITIYNGEVKNCSIEATPGDSGYATINIYSGGTKGGCVIANNILYNNGTIIDNGTGTVKVNNIVTAKTGVLA